MTNSNDPYVVYFPVVPGALEGSVIEPGLIGEYRRTLFHVYAQTPFTLRIGEPSPELAALFQKHLIDSAVYITAYSPFSTVVSADENQSAQARLTADLASTAQLVIQGDGQDPEQRWPAEQSLLGLGVGREDAVALGQRYLQNAVVWVGSDVIPQLLLLR